MGTLYEYLVYKPYVLFSGLSDGTLYREFREWISDVSSRLPSTLYNVRDLAEEILPDINVPMVKTNVQYGLPLTDTGLIERQILDLLNLEDAIIRSVSKERVGYALKHATDRDKNSDLCEYKFGDNEDRPLPQNVTWGTYIPVNKNNDFSQHALLGYLKSEGDILAVLLVYDPQKLKRTGVSRYEFGFWRRDSLKAIVYLTKENSN